MTGTNGDRREITALESVLRKSVLSRKGFLCAAFGQRGRCEYVTAVCAYADKSSSLFLSNRVAPANECPRVRNGKGGGRTVNTYGNIVFRFGYEPT